METSAHRAKSKIAVAVRVWHDTIRMIAVAALGLANPVEFGAQAQEKPQPKLRHDAARMLIGNTLVYAKPDQPGDETGVYIRLDGTGLAVARGPDGSGKPRSIRWATVSDSDFCVTEVGRKPWDGDCGALTVDGTHATLAPKGEPAWVARVMKGDAWELDPATIGQYRQSGKPAIEALVGNTLLFIVEGGSREYRAHYFMANGKVRRAHNDQPYFDNWELQPDEKWSIREKSDQLCLSGGAWKETLCVRVSIAGDLVTLWDDRIGPFHARLMSGDARYLSPAAETSASTTANTLIGNTIVLKAADRQANTDRIIYFQRRGVGRMNRGDRRATAIKWLLRRDGTLCIDEQPGEYRDGDCTMLSINGDVVTFTAPGRPAITGRILRGNALRM